MKNKIRDNSESKYYYLLLAVIILFVLLQSLFFLTKLNYAPDEESSYLLATGKGGLFINIIQNRKYPYGELVDIEKYKNLFKIDEKFCFGKVAKDTALIDIHPPLYFWLLHIWIILIGGIAYHWSGFLLNLFIGMFIIILLFKLALKLCNNFEDAFFSILLFSLSPTIYNANTARPYYLLTLLGLLISFFLLEFIEKDRKNNLFWICLFSILICLGLLCHYNFIYICFALFIFLFTNYYKKDKSLIFYFIASCLIGFLIFSNIFSSFISNLTRFGNMLIESVEFKYYPYSLPLDSMTSLLIIKRLATFFSSHQLNLIEFLLNSGQLFYYVAIVLGGLLYLLVWFSINKNKQFRFAFNLLFYPLFFMLLLFVFKKVPSWTYEEKYFLYIFPFLSLSIVLFVKSKFFNQKKIILVCLCQLLLFSTIDNLIVKDIENKDNILKTVAFSEYLENMRKDNPCVILDCSGEIYRVFKVIHYLPKKTKVIIADPDFILKNYSIYFGDKSNLFPFIFISYLPDIQQGNRPLRFLIKKIIEDNDIKLTRGIFFENIADFAEVVLHVDHNSDGLK